MTEPKNTEVRGDRKSVILGFLAAWIMRGWSKTLRFEIVDRCGVTTPGAVSPPVIFALWHSRIFTIPPVWWRTGAVQRQSVVLTSASKDGAILANAMAVFCLVAVRGTSTMLAVAAFIEGRLAFSSIVALVEAVVMNFDKGVSSTIRDLADVSAIEDDARALTREHLLRLAP